jgi:heme/copper-type cytochrome/quinol oxidase subunit 2
MGSKNCLMYSRKNDWNYELTDKEDIIIESYMLDNESLEEGDIRLLTVDNGLVLPVNTSIRLLVTSNDVIHSFAVPSLGLKSDAIPGRLNATGLIINRTSDYYGQCSELCGVLHGFMPIHIKAVKLPEY